MVCQARCQIRRDKSLSVIGDTARNHETLQGSLFPHVPQPRSQQTELLCSEAIHVEQSHHPALISTGDLDQLYIVYPGVIPLLLTEKLRGKVPQFGDFERLSTALRLRSL